MDPGVLASLDGETQGFLKDLNRQADDNDDIRHDDFDPDDIDVEAQEELMREVQEQEAQAARAGGGVPPGAGFRSKTRAKNNVGVKGVLADYNEWREEVIQENKEKAITQMAELERKALRSKYDQSLPQNNAQVERERAEEESKKNRIRKDKDEDYDSLDDSDDDDYFLEWKRKKALDVINSIPVFGTYREIGVDEYVSSVDNEHESVHVVIHLYENDVPACRSVNHCLSSLAHKYPRVKFLYILASQAQENWVRKALPTVLVYKAGIPLFIFVRLYIHLYIYILLYSYISHMRIVIPGSTDINLYIDR
tara:strand:- start:1123 stop:2049 length:927 start_codon:yes stop_codon:yes gene_type:complete